MNAIELKKSNIIQRLINTEDIDLLDRVQKVIDHDMLLTDEQYQMLNERRGKHINKNSESFSWHEVKKKLNL
jgi:hypothetical protein